MRLAAVMVCMIAMLLSAMLTLITNIFALQSLTRAGGLWRYLCRARSENTQRKEPT